MPKFKDYKTPGKKCRGRPVNEFIDYERYRWQWVSNLPQSCSMLMMMIIIFFIGQFWISWPTSAFHFFQFWVSSFSLDLMEQEKKEHRVFSRAILISRGQTYTHQIRSHPGTLNNLKFRCKYYHTISMIFKLVINTDKHMFVQDKNCSPISYFVSLFILRNFLP